MSRKLFKAVLFPMKVSVHWVNERLGLLYNEALVYDLSKKKFIIAMIG